MAPAAVTAATGTRTAAIPLSGCYPPDNGNPEVQAFSIIPGTVQVLRGMDRVTFTATPRDIGGPGRASGVAGGRLVLYLSSGTEFNTFAMKWNGHGALVQKLDFSPHDLATTWSVGLSLWDDAGNFSTYLPRDLAAAGLPWSFTSRTAARPDHDRPTVRSVQLSTATVDAARHRGIVRVRVRAAADSGVFAVSAHLYGYLPTPSRGGRLHLVHGSRTNGQWQGRLLVKRVAGTHIGKLAVDVRDYRGRSRTYGWKALTAMGAPSRVRVVGHTDTERPKLRATTVTAHTLDLRTGGPRKVTVRARVTDRGAGVREVFMFFDGSATKLDHQGYEPRMVRVSGTAHDGIWQATVSLPPCETEAGVWRGTVFAFDYGLPGRSIDTRAITVINNDIAPPSAEVVGREPVAGPITVRFDEDVVGVTTENTLVFDGDERDLVDRPGNGPARIPGTWTCRNASGVAVDCDTGPVRTAAFTPTTPFLPGNGYVLLLNPQGHLGLTDMAGNPPVDLFTDTIFLTNDLHFSPR